MFKGSNYARLPNSPGRDEALGPSSPSAQSRRTPSFITVMTASLSLLFYTFIVMVATKDYFQTSELPIPLSSFPHPKEMEYIIQHTGAKGTALEKLAFDPPSKEADEAWFSLLKPFNTRVPKERFQSMNRTSIQIADGSGDYYVTLTMYHEIHCLMRIRWFMYPEYYLNMTWEEQARDRHTMGHFKHCIWSLLESVLCHADTSIRTFHWEDDKSAPVADSFIPERKCVDREWLYEFTREHSFTLEDRVLSHPIFGQLKEDLSPVRMPEGYTLHEDVE